MMVAKNSKKRKASELEERPATNGHAKGKKGKRFVEIGPAPDEPPFKVVCPFNGQADYKMGLEQVRLGKDFNFEYAVKSFDPDSQWEDIKAYKHVRLAEMSVTVGDTVYVLHNPRAGATSPPPDATDEEILAYDKKNYWIGKILQARAKNDREVYILVAWLYWPNEVPKSMKSHPHFYGKDYADNELIMSNWLDIIDANSLSNKAEAYYLDEEDDSHLFNVPERFWRQTFNAGEATDNPKEPGLLSTLKKVCKCQRPINPGKRVLRCASDSCKIWNHEQCIIDEIGDDLWAKYDAEKMDEYAHDHAPIPKTIGGQIAGAVSAAGTDVKTHLKHLMEDGIAAVAQEVNPKLETQAKNVIKDESEGANALPITPVKKGRPRKTKGVWKASLNIIIKFDNNQPPVAQVTEKVGQKRKWNLRIDCLVCGHTMD